MEKIRISIFEIEECPIEVFIFDNLKSKNQYKKDIGVLNLNERYK